MARSRSYGHTQAKLISTLLDYNKEDIPAKINAMRTLGVPYADGYEDKAVADAEKQAEQIAKNLADAKIKTSKDREIVALIAYLQRLGTDIKK